MKRWDCLLKRINAHNQIKGAEIGIYKAKMSRALMERFPHIKLYMIDRWKAYNTEEKAGDKSCSMAVYNQHYWDKIYSKVLRYMKKYSKSIEIIKSDSIKAARSIKDESLDFVFIDGDHSYKGCSADIKAWLPKVKKSGWISGHDITRSGVRKAVEENFSHYEKDDDKTWWVQV